MIIGVFITFEEAIMVEGKVNILGRITIQSDFEKIVGKDF